MDKFFDLIEKITVSILRWICRILHKELSPEKEEAFSQFVKFGIVGVSNTFISYFLYTASLILLRKMGVSKDIDYLIAQTIAFILSVLWSFYWNNRMVFIQKDGETRNMWAALLKTYVSYSFTGLFLSNILLFFWIKVLHINEFIAPLINLIVSVPVNFIINKFWAFKTDK